MIKKHIRIKALNNLVETGALRFTGTFFPYTSGQIGPYCVQSAAVQSRGKTFFSAIYSMNRAVMGLLKDNPDIDRDFVITGGETRDWMFSMPVASSLQKPHTMLYKDGRILGASLRDREVIHVADLNNEGSSPRDYWVPMIRDAGGRVNNIVFYVDRLEGGVQVMKDLDLESRSVVPLNNSAWSYLQRQNIINEEVYRSLRERMEDKTKWAHDMLRSEKGFERLVSLIQDPKTEEKGWKIVETYEGVYDELWDRLITAGVTT